MNLYIYDIEVFSHDWIVVFRNPTAENNHIVIHNDNYHLREFLNQPDIVIGGFNNKWYDDWVVLTMLLGGDNTEVKKHNDFIIKERRNGWEFPFVQYQKRPFNSFDLKDDIADKQISLKAIEGNLKLPIVESSVSFDIDRPLTEDELEEVIRYCKYDVDSTVKLYETRKEDYIDAKILISDMYGVPINEGVGLTNAKLCARILGAKPKKFDDEREYVIPDNIDLELIPKVVFDFFMLIHDKSIPDIKLFGDSKQNIKGMTLKVMIKTALGECPVTYAWGGVHGAKPCITVEETSDRVIINQDVASLYPNSMLNFGYCSRAMEDPEAYRKLVEKRLIYKNEAKVYWKKLEKKLGSEWYEKYNTEDLSWDYNLDVIRRDVDEETFSDILSFIEANRRQASIKLPINTTYGAMLNRHNDLGDRLAGRSVCISNQLAMTMLIVQLAKECESIDFVNINTDGIMFTINRSEVELSERIIADWSEVTRFKMERDDFVKVIQKDVNNYIGIKADGSIKTKGDYVSTYGGGNFKTNSLEIIDRAVVDYLVKGVPVEKTINDCRDIFAFQQIVKTGSTYEGSYHYVNGERVPVQKVNRIYAVHNAKYGSVVKGKWITEKRRKNKVTGKMEIIPVEPPQWSETVISECPEHCFIDNENVLTVDELEKGYYINMAKKRIDKYINIDRKVENEIKKIEEVIVIMAEAKTKNTAVTLNVYGKLVEARKRFLESKVKKSGKNTYAEFKYFTLDDIIPIKQAIFKELGLVDVITFHSDEARLILTNVDNTDEHIIFTSQLDKDESLIKNPIQKVGAIQTYVRRYLYMLMLDIIESDGIEATTGKPGKDTDNHNDNSPITPEKPKSKKPVNPAEREGIKKDLIDADGEATEVQIKSIKLGLRKLRDKGTDNEPYIKTCLKKIKAGLNKKEAEDLLIEIGNKVEA